ncbi:MAG: hypothetical protein RLP09_09575 [Sandaracinaceae bacterium]
MPPRSQPFGVLRDDGAVDVTTADGRSVVLPRDLAEGAGVEIRSSAPTANLGAFESQLTAGDPTLDPRFAAFEQQQQPTPDAPPVAPAADGVPPMLARAPQAPAPAPAAPAPLDQALVDMQARPQPGAAPAAAFETPIAPAVPTDPRTSPSLVGDPEAQAAHRSLLRPNNDPRALPGERFLLADGSVYSPPAPDAPAPARAGRAAPAPEEPTDPNAELVDALIERPRDQPIAPGDFRQSSPLDRQIERIDRGQRRAQEAADAATAASIDRQELLERQAAEQRALEVERAAAMTQAETRYAEAFEAARSAEINPRRLWQNGGGVAMAIATALGGLGAAITGGENGALAMIERAIDRDIRAQESNQANAQRTAQNARSFIDLTRQRFTDEAAAQQAARSLAWDQVAQRLEGQMSGLRSAQEQDRAQALIDQARAQALQAAQAAAVAEAERDLNMRQQVAEIRKTEAEAARAERRAMGGGGGRRANGVVPTELVGTPGDPVVQQAQQFLGMDELTAREMAANTSGGSRSGRSLLLRRISEAQSRSGRLANGLELEEGRTLDDQQVRQVNGLVAADREFNAAIQTIEQYADRLREDGLLGYAWEQLRGRAGFGSQDFQTLNHAVDVIRTQFRNINQSGNSLGAQTMAEHDFPNLTQNISLDAILNNVRAARDVKHRYVEAVLENLGIHSGGGGHGGGHGGGEQALPEGVRPR